MKDAVSLFCFALAAVVPFALIPKWRHWGLLVSVLFGWFVIHFGNMATRAEWSEPVDAVFAGLWAAVGWLYMMVWCLPIYGYVWFRARKAQRASATQLNTEH